MKIQELRQMNLKKLWEQLKKVQRELAVARFHVKTQQSADTSQISKKRRMVARIKTLINNQAN
jgi:ribosomal protein L29